MASGHYWKGTNKIGNTKQKNKQTKNSNKQKKSERMSVFFSVKVSFLCQKNRANYNFLRSERFKNYPCQCASTRKKVSKFKPCFNFILLSFPQRGNHLIDALGLHRK